jgi:hypothetical protein
MLSVVMLKVVMLSVTAPFLSLRKNGRYFCAHPNCLDPTTKDLRSDAESWLSMTQLWRHFEQRHAVDADLAFKCELCDAGFTTRAQCYKTFYCGNLLPFRGHTTILL